MHVILRLRLYLLYFFRQPTMRKFAYFFSHFNITYHVNGLIINIFYYDGRLENDWDEFISSSFSSRIRSSFKIFDKFVFQRFYLLLLLLLLINSVVMSRLAIKGFIEHFLKPRRQLKPLLKSSTFKQGLQKTNLKKVGVPRARLFKRPSFFGKSLLIKNRKKNSFARASFILFTRLVRNYFILYLRHNSNYGKRR
jgi:hypothetical protein